jgi:CRP/FNR family transcriptional regulator
MAKVIEINCESCNKLRVDCCKSCFKDVKNNIFKSLSTKEIDLLICEKQHILYNPGETIVKQNTSSSTVVCIKEGLAKVYVEYKNGKNVIVRIAKKGDFLTGGGLFNGSVQHFSVAALTTVKCCMINTSYLTSLFSENSEFALGLMRKHTQQNNYLLNKLVDHTQKYMPGRVADTLLYLSDEIFQSDVFKIPLSRIELAEMSNMTKESFVRILQQFKESKIIHTEGHKVTITDKSSLIEISENG